MPVRVDLDRQLAIARRFNVYAGPTYAVITADGTVLSQCMGFQPVEQFLAFLDQASTGSAAKSQ